MEYKEYFSYDDLSSDEEVIIKKMKNYTMTGMTGPERMITLIRSVKYVIQNNIKGDFVECGVWRGGMMMLIALVLNDLGIKNRKLYLYDTFEGMTEPSNLDISYKGENAIEEYAKT